ncbi:MAG TPA: hypothetical protein VFW87_08120, partial [Pirellulales bacterium]|nr:hypothetical protein [Pirellulales bacterium]
AGRLFLVPASSEPMLLAGWANRAADGGAVVVRKLHRRDEILAAALAGCDEPKQVDAALAADFLALGLAYLLVELLTRQMRYMSNIDEIHLRNQTVAAAEAAVAGEAATAREKLRACFEVLADARERFYPVEAYLIDLVLTAPTTLGPSLRRELSGPTPKSVLIGGRLIEEIAASQPETLAALRHSLEQGTLSLAGGEYDEGELSVWPIESVVAGLQRGEETYQRLLGCRTVVYGRRRYGLTPLLPGVLSLAGFDGALHFTLDEGNFPRGGQGKTRWEGLGISAIDALGRLPLDANVAESLLSYPRRMGESMDADHVATLVFAHWPGQVSPFFEDLRRTAAYAPVLGRFVTLSDYFQNTDRPGELTRFRADQYRAPYLRQAIVREEADPLSRLADLHRRCARATSIEALATLAALLGDSHPSTETASCAAQLLHAARLPADGPADVDASGKLDTRLNECLAEVAAALAGRLAAQGDGCLLLNPQPVARRVSVCLPALSQPPETAGPVAAVQPSEDGMRVAVDLPPMGFAWVGPGADALASAPRKSAAARSERRSADKEPAIRNDLLQVAVSQQTGGIRSIHEIGRRGNLLSQQLGFRLPAPRPQPGEIWRDPDQQAVYSTMLAERVEVTAAGAAFSQIVSRGQLVDEAGERVAGFVQTIELARGSRVVGLEIELEVEREPRADPWNSYYASRFAWGDEGAELRRGVGLASQLTDARNIESPYFVEIGSQGVRATVLCGGLAYHRRIGQRMLDTLLVVRGERRRTFRLGIGAGLAHPAAEALALLDPPVVVPGVAAPRSAPSGWLLHLDAKNIVATHWETVLEGDRAVGFRVRLWETEGRAGRVHLRAFKRLTSARQIDLHGNALLDLTIDDDRVALDVAAYEWLAVEGRFTG